MQHDRKSKRNGLATTCLSYCNHITSTKCHRPALTLDGGRGRETLHKHGGHQIFWKSHFFEGSNRPWNMAALNLCNNSQRNWIICDEINCRAINYVFSLSPQWALGEANAMANYYKNSSIYPPPLLIRSLTRLCASIWLYVTCTATCASFTPTRIFQHTPSSPVKRAHPALPHSAASQNWHISCAHAWRLRRTKDFKRWSAPPPTCHQLANNFAQCLSQH